MLPLLCISLYQPVPHCENDVRETRTDDENHLRTLLQLRTMETLHEYAGALWKFLDAMEHDIEIDLQWEYENATILDTHNLHQELDVCLWNLASLQVSACETPTTKLEWNTTSQNLQTAASYLHHCQLLSDASVYEILCVAEGQRCVYQGFSCHPRPKHFLLAKLCMTVANLYTYLEEEFELDNTIADAVRAWGMYITSLAEYHQAQVDQGSAAAARMENCRKFASFCADFLETCDVEIPELTSFMETLDAIPVDPNLLADELLDLDELPEIPAQPAVIKINTDLESMLKIPENLFRTVKKEFLPMVTQCEQSIRSIVARTARTADQKTETARTALQSVHLPQSISHYTEQHDVETNHDTSGLQNCSETAWGIVARIDRMVDTCMSGDIQQTFLSAISQYKSLLEKAAASDGALLDRPLPDVPTTTPEIVTELSQSLAQLSVLFRERDDIMRNLRTHVERMNLKSALLACETESQVRQILDTARRTVEETHVKELERNIEKQSKLLYQIMQENDRFQRDEDLAMMEDAVSQHERFARHLQQGMDFYKNILPRLEKLERQIAEVCERLTEERTVDDEKVANLVAMDFEFEKVVNALRKHDNNFEQALNDLLSC